MTLFGFDESAARVARDNVELRKEIKDLERKVDAYRERFCEEAKGMKYVFAIADGEYEISWARLDFEDVNGKMFTMEVHGGACWSPWLVAVEEDEVLFDGVEIVDVDTSITNTMKRFKESGCWAFEDRILLYKDIKKTSVQRFKKKVRCQCVRRLRVYHE